MKGLLTALLIALCAIVSGGCTSPQSGAHDVNGLALQLRALAPGVDPAEAERAARIAYDYSSQLAREYQITDPPLVHNAKVNRGLRPRGLCWHWAEDIEKRLRQENFQTLSLHRAIANSDKLFRIDHSTTIISARGDSMFDGVVVDPWRYGGALYWGPTLDDASYDWRPRMEVLDEKRRRRDKRQGQTANG